MNTINWQETYIIISPKLLGICRRYIKDIATAEDIVQDSFIVAIQKENTLKDANAVNGWLSRIVINMAIHHLKETKKIIFSTSSNFEVVDNSTLMNISELNNKSRLLAADLDGNDVLEAIDGLPEHHKSVFNMYVIDQFSHNDIAKSLEISVGTSKSHLSRARKSIQTFLLEKIKNNPVDENKKRKMAFLIFLGFGNTVFASFYQSKFQGFEIVSKTPFSLIPKNISVPNQFIGLSKVFLVLKIAIIAVSISLVGVGTYYSSSNTKIPDIKKNEVVLENKSNKNILASDDKKIEALKENDVVVNEVIPTLVPKEKITKINPKKEIVLTSILAKDSIKTESPKVVVIKKQIIKRDTVYVTK